MWLVAYVDELTSFPNSPYNYQVDSTSQALEWINRLNTEPNMLKFLRLQLAEQNVMEGLPHHVAAAEAGVAVEALDQFLEARKPAAAQAEEVYRRFNSEFCDVCALEIGGKKIPISVDRFRHPDCYYRAQG